MGSYITFPQSKGILNKFRGDYSEEFNLSRTDIKPDWGVSGNGYPYSGIDKADTDFIYQAISALPIILRSKVFEFDIQKHFIKPEKAIKQLVLC